jgi:hypothetical protein
MHITITQEDIDASRALLRALWEREAYAASPAALCPIARALKRVTGDVWVVGIFSTWQQGQPGPSIPLPSALFRFRLAFDAQEDVQPIEADIEIPAP